MRVVFKDTSKFIVCPDLSRPGRHLAEAMPTDYQVLVRIPPVYVSGFMEQTDSLLDAAKHPATQIVIWTAIVIDHLANVPDNIIWSGFNALSLVSSMALFNIVIPDNALSTFVFLKNMTKFEIIEHEPGIRFTPTQPLNVNFDRLGIQSLNFFECLGPMKIVLGVVLLAQLLQLLCMTLMNRFKGKIKIFKSARRTVKRIKRSVLCKSDRFTFASTLVRLFLLTFIDTLIAVSLAFMSSSQISVEGNDPNKVDRFSVACAGIAFIGQIFMIGFFLY